MTEQNTQLNAVQVNGTAKVVQATNKEIRPELYLQTSLMIKHDKDNKI